MRQPGPLAALQTKWVAILLTWTAGFIDIVGYISIFGVFTSHMTGNTAHLGIYAGAFSLSEVARYGWPIVMFVVGLLLGSFLIEMQKRGALHTPFPPTLALEMVLVATFIAAAQFGIVGPRTPPSVSFYIMVAILAVAMGLQNVTIRKIGGINLYTTFITGTLVKFGEAFSTYLLWFYDRAHGRSRLRVRTLIRLSVRNAHFRRAALTAAIWIAYFVGATAGVIAHRWAGFLSLAFPLGALALVTAYGAISPFVIRIEYEW